MMRLLFLCVLSAALCAQTAAPVRSWADADKLEAELEKRPNDLNIRTQLLRYYAAQGQTAADRVKPLRRKHILWLVEHHPETTTLSETSGIVLPGDEGFADCRAAWERALAAPFPVYDTYANAASFFRSVDLARARRIVDEGLQRYPGNARLADRRGQLLAYSILGATAFDPYGNATAFQPPNAAAEMRTLESSTDANEIGSVARTLQMQLNALQANRLSERIRPTQDLIVRLYQRADQLDPSYDRWKMSLAGAYQTFAYRAGTPSEKLELLAKGLAAAGSNTSIHATILGEMARTQLAAGDLEKASTAAKELLAVDLDKTSWAYSSAVFAGHTVLGGVALAHGDAAEASRRLLLAGRVPANPSYNTNGPSDWRLAQDLLNAGDRDTVAEYLGLLRNSWKSGTARLNTWISTIRSGGTVTLAPGVDFPKDRYTGRAAPEFRLKNLQGADVTLADYKGKVVLLDFWATWCGPCRQEMPEFEKIHRGDAGPDVVVLALDVDEAQEIVVEYLAKEKFTFPILLGKGTGVVERYGVHAYPTTFAIDKQGLVADVIVGGGPNGRVRLDALIAKARAGAPAPAPEPTALKIAPRPATPEDLYRDAARLHAAKDYEGAAAALARAIQLRPDWIVAVFNRADAEFYAKHYDEAIAGFTRAIELDPKRSASYDGRGLAYSNSGRHAQAIPDYTRAIELAPNSPTAYNNRGWAYLETGRLEEALADLNRALEINPAYTLSLFNRAHLFEKWKDYAKAVADYDAVLRVEPENASAESQKAADLRRMQ